MVTEPASYAVRSDDKSLLVFNQQRRRANALHPKIYGLLLAMKGARDELAGAEHAPDDEIERLREDRSGGTTD